MTQTCSSKPLHQQVTSGEADLDAFRKRLTASLAEREEVDAAAGVEVTAVTRPESSGMSSISVPFDASWPAPNFRPSCPRLPGKLRDQTCQLFA
ncbi:hypothetical protein [Dietzia sp. B32]|uniref:hypothetical protein n=1 Tax=Dietzia sp. B32 TaxID=2915130 RepID=UPI0021AD951B|nr:hypothetical protein [Dietzia sp. B32]UVE94408.1 hypothetical protein L8M95_12835 [Dietzia sp. B32]